MSDPSGDRTQRLRIGALAAALVVLAGVVSWQLIHRPPAPRAASPPPTVAPRPCLAVLGLKNAADRSEAGWISTAIAEALAAGLGDSGALRIVPSENVARMTADLGLDPADDLPAETLKRVGQHLGADLLVLGSYEATRDGRVRLDLRLRRTATGQPLGDVAEAGTQEALVDLVSRTEARLRRLLGVAPAPADAAAAAALPAKPEAARLYAEGLARLRVFDALAARDLLQRAAAVEPEHPLIHLALAESWSLLGFDDRALDETRQAFERSAGQPLPARLAIEARHREVVGERERAAEIRRTLFGFFPDNLDYGLAFASAQTAAGQRREALATLEALRRMPRTSSDDPRIDLLEARAANALGDYHRGQAAAERAARKGEARGARLLVAESRLVAGYSLRAMGEPVRAVAADEAAKQVFAAAGYRRGEASALLEIASVLRYQGELGRARAMAEEALRHAQAIGDRSSQCLARGRVASVLSEQGHLAEALRLYQETLLQWRETGDRTGEATTLNNIGETLWKLGRLGAARESLEASSGRFRSMGSRRGAAFSLFNLGFVAFDAGDLPGARRAFEESLRLSRATGERSLAAVATFGLGNLLLAEGSLPEARRAHEDALAQRRALGERGRTAESLVALGRLALEEGHFQEAEEAAREAAREFRSEAAPQSEALAQAVLAEALVGRWSLDEAQRTIGEAMALAQGEAPVPRLVVAVAAARVSAATDRPVEGVKQLRAIRAEASQRGLVGIALTARLALAEIEMRFGDAKAGRRTIDDLARDARAAGFVQVARRAAAAGSPRSAP